MLVSAGWTGAEKGTPGAALRVWDSTSTRLSPPPGGTRATLPYSILSSDLIITDAIGYCKSQKLMRVKRAGTLVLLGHGTPATRCITRARSWCATTCSITVTGCSIGAPRLTETRVVALGLPALQSPALPLGRSNGAPLSHPRVVALVLADRRLLPFHQYGDDTG